MRPPEIIETERLILRKPHLEDAIAIHTNYAQDAEVTRYLTWPPNEDLTETRYYLGLALQLWEEGKAYSYAITLKGSDSSLA